MLLTWYGHSCFLLEGEDGTRILTDPCDQSTGYTLADIDASAVTVSHDHFDHNDLSVVSGTPRIIREAGCYTCGGAEICCYPAFHDDARGQKRGANLLTRITLDGIRTLHLGDLGHIPSDALVAEIGPVDVLLCPVGGVFTIDAAQAKTVAGLFNPQIFIPMHYKTKALSFDVAGLDPLLRLCGKERVVHRINGSTCTITRDSLAEKRILLMDYVRS